MKQEQLSPKRRFERLSRLKGFHVDKHQIDPRGWSIASPVDGRAIGEVKDLFVDTERMAAAYVDVQLDTKLFDLSDDPRLLVPMHRVRRDGDHKRLIIDGLTREHVTELRLAREEHNRLFWDDWWGTEGTPGRQSQLQSSDTVRPAAVDPAPVPQSGRETIVTGPQTSMHIPVETEEVLPHREHTVTPERVVAREGDYEAGRPPRIVRDDLR